MSDTLVLVLVILVGMVVIGWVFNELRLNLKAHKEIEEMLRKLDKNHHIPKERRE